MKIFTTILIIALLKTYLIGQNHEFGKSIVLDKYEESLKNLFIQEYKEHIKLTIGHLKTKYNDNTGKQLVNEYKELSEEILSQVNEGKFIFNLELDSLVKINLRKFGNEMGNISNTNLFLISKEWELNAYCLSDGLIVINAGTFYWLDNDAQLASIIAHELAHHIMDHYNITRYEELKNKKINQAAIVNIIKNNPTNQSKIATNRIKDEAYQKARNRRTFEFEADSVGLTLYKNTLYSLSEYTKAMELIIKYDTLPSYEVDTMVYYSLYDLPQQPFKSHWLEGEDFNRYNYTELKNDIEINTDSIATHPEFVDRIAKIKNLYDYKDDTLKHVPSELYNRVSQMIKHELIPIHYYNERYDFALYSNMILLSKDKDNTYYQKWMSLLFEKIYEGRKSYNLNRYIEVVDMRRPMTSFQQFLGFIWALKLNEIKTIADHYKG